MNARLLIIDPQNDFCDIAGAALPVPGANADMHRLAGLMKQARGNSPTSGHARLPRLSRHRAHHFLDHREWTSRRPVHPDRRERRTCRSLRAARQTAAAGGAGLSRGARGGWPLQTHGLASALRARHLGTQHPRGRGRGARRLGTADPAHGLSRAEGSQPDDRAIQCSPGRGAGRARPAHPGQSRTDRARAPQWRPAAGRRRSRPAIAWRLPWSTCSKHWTPASADVSSSSATA